MSKSETCNQPKHRNTEERGYGEWTTVQRSRRRRATTTKGNTSFSVKGNEGINSDKNQTGDSGANHAPQQQKMPDKKGSHAPSKTDSQLLSTKESAGKGYSRASAATAKSLAKDASGSTSVDIRISANGSRFSRLLDLAEEEGSNQGMVEMDSSEIQGAECGPQVLLAKEKGKSAAREEGVVLMEGVNVRASDSSLFRAKETLVGSRSTSGGRKMKEHALKDVSNVLEARPINLKPYWTRLKSGVALTAREACPISKWVAHGGRSADLIGVLAGHRDLTRSGGPNHCRPPDPSSVPDTSKSLSHPQSPRFEGIGGGGGRHEEREAEEEVYMECMTHEDELKAGLSSHAGQQQ